MLDNSEEKSSISWHDILGIVRRRRWWFLIPLVSVWAIATIGVYVMKAGYRSLAVVLVSRPSVPSDYVAPNVQIDMAERLQSMTQQILSRLQLQRIIQDSHLYPELAQKAGPDQLVQRMREDIHIDPVPLDSLGDSSVNNDPATAARRALMEPNGKMPEAIAFNISYVSNKPYVAQQVTNQLISLFIEENLREREQKSEMTTGFLRNQMDDARVELQAQERHIQEFKTRYLGQLPAQLEGNVQILSGLQARLQAVTEAVRRAEEQKLYLGSLHAQYQSMLSTLRQGNADTLHSPAALDRELQRLRSQLTDLSGHYTERYPDVIHLKEQLAEAEKLKKEIDTNLAAQANSQVAASQTGAASAPAPTSYADVQAMTPMLQIESQLAANKREIEDQKNQIGDLQKSIQQYQARINAVPLLEQELAELTRDYDQSRAHYQSLLDKRNQSQVATNLEKRQQGQQFVVLSPPSLPSKPDSPNRILISLIGVGVGLVVGGMLAAVVELGDDRIHSDREVKEIIPASVLADIPDLRTASELRNGAKLRGLQFAAAALIICVMILGNLAIYLHG